MRKEVTQKDAGYKHMPETIFATPKKTWSWYEVVVDCSGNPTNNRKAHPRYRYVRADLISKDYIRRAVTKEEAGRLSGVVDFTLKYFEEELPKEEFPGVWNEPLSPYVGGLTPNDIVELKKLLETHK